ncbi:MAG: ParB/RepB/Spo0J family partition protein [Clostridia bacterium]
MKPRLTLISTEKIVSNSQNYIRDYSKEDIQSLADSVRRFGLIEPIIVKKRNIGYVVVCGERRFRACKKARLQKIPCIIVDYTLFLSNTINFNDNFHIKSLNFIEKYIAVKSYIENWNFTHDECANILNLDVYKIEKIMLLDKLSLRQLEIIKNSNLSEKQVLTAIKIVSDEEREKFLLFNIRKNYNDKQTEMLYKKMIDIKNGKQLKGVISPDLRVLLNTINRAVEAMKNSGIEVDYVKTDNEEKVECFLNIKKPVFSLEDH